MGMKFCHSCGIILDGNIAKEATPNFCQYCVDEKGSLKPREEIKAGIEMWLKSYGPKDESIDYAKRAESYMNAMPAWAK